MNDRFISKAGNTKIKNTTICLHQYIKCILNNTTIPNYMQIAIDNHITNCNIHNNKSNEEIVN